MCSTYAVFLLYQSPGLSRTQHKPGLFGLLFLPDMLVFCRPACERGEAPRAEREKRVNRKALSISLPQLRETIQAIDFIAWRKLRSPRSQLHNFTRDIPAQNKREWRLTHQTSQISSPHTSIYRIDTYPGHAPALRQPQELAAVPLHKQTHQEFRTDE